MTIMNSSLKKTLLAASLAALPLSLNAAGLGRINVLSALGQPLNAEIEVQAGAEEISSMTARMAPPDVFQQSSVPFAPVISLIRVGVEPRGSGAVIKLSSERPVSEPFVDMVVELNWANGKLIREYTFLLDPAIASGKAVGAVAAPQAPKAAAAAPAAPAGKPMAATAPSQTVAPAMAADSYRVARGDTLSKIARASKPQGVSLEQMLVALLRRNPDAFANNNMNRLKAGRILSIPSASDAAGIAQAEAKREVVAQAADFNAYRRRLAESVRSEAPSDTAESQQQGSGLIKPRIAEAPKPGDEARDKVRVSKTEMGQGGAAGGASERLRMLEEDLAARDRALQEANDRLAELERNIAELQKLVELKSQGLAQAQQSAEKAVAGQAAEPAPAEPAPAPAEPAAAEPSAESAAPAAVAQPTEPAAAELAPAPAEPQPAPVEQPPAPVEQPPAAVEPPPPPPAPKPAPKPVPPPEPVAAPSFLDDLLGNPMLLAAGGGLIALLVALGVMRSRKKGAATESQLAMGAPSELSMGGGSVFGTSGGQSVNTGSSVIQTDFSQSGMSAIDADEGVDPVAEADVYMAYGRDAQAEEILLDALKADPSRAAVHLKLLEIYAQRNSTAQFEATASELYSRTGGQGDDWSRAAEMGRKLDPENPLYSAAGGAAAAAAAASVSESMKPTMAKVPESAGDEAQDDEQMSALDFPPHAEKPEIEGASAKLKDTWAMPGDLSQFGESQGDLTASGGLSQSTSSALDFNLDLGDALEAEEPVAEQRGPATEGGGVSPSAAISDSTVKLSAADLSSDADESTLIKAQTPEDDLVLADASETTLEFDLDFNEDEQDAAAEPGAAAEAELPGLDPSVDETAGQEPVVDQMASGAMDSALDFDLDVSDVEGGGASPGSQAAESPQAEVPDLSFDLPPAEKASAERSAAEASAEEEDAQVDLSATIANPVADKGAEEMATDLEQSSFDGTLLDFDFELDKPGVAEVPDVEATALDISAINLDLEQEAGQAAGEDDVTTRIMPAPEPQHGEPAAPQAGEPAGAAAADDKPGDPEVDTKLELARAYEEMGDKDGARELLEEVLAEGSTGQQDQARLVMSRL